jgi:hypothetical protein
VVFFPRRAFMLWVVLLSAMSAHAEVADSSAFGFTIKRSTTVNASAEKIYRNLVEDVGRWWDSAHTFSGDAKNLFMESKANGCFCEHLPNGGSVRHMTIVLWEPAKRLRLTGGLGPLQSLAVVGTLSWELKAVAESTEIEMIYTVGGYAPGGLQGMGTAVEEVLGVQLQRFKTYAETGKTPK